nr:DNA/RNA nuclease SfsA [Candidatus Sigynarchaeota archaeon]
MIIAHGLIPATFVKREHKYLVTARLNDQSLVQAFLPDPGRLKELLFPGATIFLVKAGGPTRKTAFDMVAVKHDALIVSLDTRVPNRYVRWLLETGYLFDGKFDEIRPEYLYKDSRIDFLARKNKTKYLIEVKSVTLVESGVALFPDAPTKRGTRHVRELTDCRIDGFEPVLVFVIQRPDASSFRPNERTDPEFAAALIKAKQARVIMNIFTNKTFIDPEQNFCMEPLARVILDF